MLTNSIEFLLEVAFEFTLFLLLVIFVVHLFKKYALPELYKQMQAIKKRFKDLKQKRQLLIASENRIEQEISDQEESFTVLEKRVQMWYNFKKQENKEQLESSQQHLDTIKNKRKKQKINLDLLKMEEVVIPESIDLACKKIEKEYGGEKGLELLKELVVTIEPKN